MQGTQPDVTAPRSPKRMTLVTEHEIPDSVPPTTTTVSDISSTRTDVEELLTRAAWRAGIIASLTVVTQILAVRLVLLVAVLGAIGLTYLAVSSDDLVRLGALAVYCAAVVGPVVLLAYKRAA